ncbi:hypothetical protein HYPSUDRAFT_40795 [Hypholoma sublateritium FD-334 SS-4]|uniref:F-box domain-containing protein n=1 Tax=Hypholoma sublateritium (strain FD-334 SS-4) TaxID=945553 RepID=A0A0D2PSI2_HYPSF|nr:hypothetical protein HYPSUDRAFT_40795 [Hypholoma sublateritium FD-334 SS-4]
MEHCALSSDSVLQTLLKTNRPPTDREKAIIQESVAPTTSKLKVVEAQISDTMAHIQALMVQVEQAETKLARLREEEAAILETFADHRRVFSPFRNLPEDILREICIACVEDNMPMLSYLSNPWPFVLAQISSGMRHVALTTPIIWASMHVDMRLLSGSIREQEQAYSVLAQRARIWIERAGGLALTVFIQGSTYSFALFESHRSDPSSILFDTLLSYSTRWKALYFDSRCGSRLSTPMSRIAALTAVEVPLLQTVSLHFDASISNTVFNDSVLLTLPTLKHVELKTDNIQMFTVDWGILTSVTLRGIYPSKYHSKTDIARILQQTKCLEFCNIVVGPDRPQEHYSEKIGLPFLKTFAIRESTIETASYLAPSILDLITAPNLDLLHIREGFFDFAGFFQRSPCITELSLPYFDKDESLTDTMGLLRHCPSLDVLCLWPAYSNIGTRNANGLLRSFVEQGDVGIICPRLQGFEITGKIDFSLETLRLFLEGKQGKNAIPNVLPWRILIINIGGITAAETRQQMVDLVSQKKAAGLDVEVIGG